MIGQQYYTSTQKDIDGNAGFGIKAKSPDMPDSVSRTLSEYSRYGKPFDIDDTDIPAMPVSFSFFSASGGKWGIMRCRYVGQDYSGRWGNFFAHTLVVGEDDLGFIHRAPILMMNSALWVSDDRSDNNDLPELPALETQNFESGKIKAFVSGASRDARFAEMIQALISLPETGRKIILVDDDANVPQWITALTYALPARLRHVLTFSTYQRNPGPLDLALIATRLDGDFRFTSTEYNVQNAIFNFVEGKFSTGLEPQRAAEMLAGAVARGDFDALHAVEKLADDLAINDIRQLDSLAALHLAIAQGVLSTDPATLKIAADLLLASEESVHSEAFDIIRDLFGGILRNCDIERLDALTQAYHGLAVKTSHESFFENDCLELLRHHFSLDEGVGILKYFINRSAEMPLLARVLKEGLSVDDWTELLAAGKIDERTLVAAWPIIRPLATRQDGEGYLTLWRSLAEWSLGHSSPFALEKLKGIIQSNNLDLAMLRSVSDSIDPILSGVSTEEFLDVIIELLSKAIAISDDDSGWQGDIERFTDTIVGIDNAEALFEKLIAATTCQPDALIFALKSTLDTNPDLAKPSAEIIFESPDLDINSLIKKILSEPDLKHMANEFIGAAFKSGKLMDLLKVLVEQAPGGPAGQQAQGFIEHSVRVLQDGQADTEEYGQLKELIEGISGIQVPLLTNGQIVMGMIGTSKLRLIKSRTRLQALQAALKTVDYQSADYGCPRFSLHISIADMNIRAGKKSWKEISEDLAIRADQKSTEDIYKQYLHAVLQMMIDYKISADGEELFPGILVDEEWVGAFVEKFAKYVQHFKDKSKVQLRLVLHAVIYLAKTWPENRENAQLASHLIRVIKKDEQPRIDNLFKAKFKKQKRILIWWKMCYQGAGKGLVSRIIGSFTSPSKEGSAKDAEGQQASESE